MVHALGLGKDQDVRTKQIQDTIEQVEDNKQDALVPRYPQPVVESSL